MFTRLTRLARVRAGWLLAIVYLVCAMMPGAAFAFGDSMTAAHCLTIEQQGMNHAGMPADAASVSMHHEHMHMMQGDDAQATSVQAMPDGAEKAPVKTSHKAPDMQCCGLFSLGALPAVVADVLKPVVPVSVCKADDAQAIADNTPPRFYRPPIS
jgi:hypothetical protein